MNDNAGVALITGSSTGIGRDIACEFARLGNHVILTARSSTELAKTRDTIQEKGGAATVFECDLTDKGQLEELTEKVTAGFSQLNILVHAAGVWHNSDRAYHGVNLINMPGTELDEVMTVGLLAPMHLTRLLLPQMKKAKRGKILAISGTFSDGGASWLHYYVSKSALERFIEGIADELKTLNIQANCISPADTNTPALRKFFPEDAATALDVSEISQLASFLVSRASDNITGQTITVRKSLYS